MVKTLLSTHADTYTHAHKHTCTHTPQQIYCWQLRVQYHSMNTARMQFYRYIEHTCIRTHTPTSLGTQGPQTIRLHGIRARSVRGVDSGGSRQVGTASRPLFCFGLSTVHYIDKDNDISLFIFQYVATR